MKTKKMSHKLSLNKTTIVNMGGEEQQRIKAGYLFTEWGNCKTWNDDCITVAITICGSADYYTKLANNCAVYVSIKCENPASDFC